MRSKFAKVIDSIVLATVFSILIYAWMRFYTKNTSMSIVVGICSGLLIMAVLNIVFYNKEQKLHINKQTKSNAEKLSLNLLCSTTTQINDFFSLILSDKSKLKRNKNYLILEENSAQNDTHSTVHNTLIFPKYEKETFNLDDLFNIIKSANKLNVLELKIFSPTISDEAKTFAKQVNNYKIEFVDKYQLYNNYVANKFENEQPKAIDISKPKLNYMGLLHYAVNQKRTRHYLLFGLLILLMSFLVPFKIYYLVLGSLLCLIALIVKIAPIIIEHRNLKQSQSEIEK